MQIAYEPHPVTLERKAELRAQGFKIIDAKFKPCGAEDPAPNANGLPSKSAIATMKKADCVEWLETHGIDGPKGSVIELRETLRQVLYLEV